MRRALAFLFSAAVSPALLWANPTGGDVAAGSATIAGQGSSAVTINQASHTAIINWQTFSIGSGEVTKFIQPSSTSATLNRVLGGQTSIIDGTLSANGQIYLINGNGIIVGPGGVVAVNGFVGSTRDITDADFLSGHLHFVGGNDAGVRNLGTIHALGGDVVLIGKTVDNEGTIKAGKTAGLVAGDDVLLAQKNADGSTITVNPVAGPTTATGKVGVKNTGTITASRAELQAANGNIYALAIQNQGIIRATTVRHQGGRIYLTADSGAIVNSGTLDASATAARGHGGTIVVKSAAGKVVDGGAVVARGGQGGTGGSVDLSAGVLSFTGTVDLTAPGGTLGSLLLDPTDIIVESNGQSYAIDPNASTLTGASIATALESSDVTLSATNSITINDSIVWDTAGNLTLKTTGTSGSLSSIAIQINATIQGTNGTLTLNAATPTNAVSPRLIQTNANGIIDVAHFKLQSGAWFQLADETDWNGSANVDNGGDIPQAIAADGTRSTASLPGFTASDDFEVATGATFLRADGGNGNATYYALVDIYGIQGMAGFLGTNFTLNGNQVDASVTANWNDGAGFAPIGSTGTPYEGSFSNGTIVSLTIHQPDATGVGLFADLGADGVINNIAINNSQVTGYASVGLFAGQNDGTIEGISSYYGTVTGSSSAEAYEVGGLVGENDGTLTDSSFNYGTVKGSDDVGGLAGGNYGTASGLVGYDNTVSGQTAVGGVIGYNDSGGTADVVSIETGSVTVASNGEGYYFGSNIGGLIGENDGTLENSNTYPGATVTGDKDVGGLVGYNKGTINDSYNSATVTGRTTYAGEGGGDVNIGGIAGENYGSPSVISAVVTQELISPQVSADNSPGIVENSYNTGAIDGGSVVGGLVGLNDSGGTVNTAYNVGSVGDSGTTYSGGIVGDNFGSVLYTYDSGPVHGVSGTAAALIGYDEATGYTVNSYWDTTTSDQGSATNADETAFENQLASVGSGSPQDTAYTITGNNQESGAGYGFFGTAIRVADTNGVYEIGSSWYIIDGQTRPMLAMEANNNVQNPHQLQLIDVNLGGSYYITHAIDAGVITNPAEVWTTEGFDPLGGDPSLGGVAFNGTSANPVLLEGNYETIQGLYISRSQETGVGLFGYIGVHADVRDLFLNDSEITGGASVGGIAGVNHGTFYNDQNNNDGNSGYIIAEGDDVGGLAGDNFGQITYGQNNGPIVGGGDNIGGIVGVNESGATLGEDTNSGLIEGNTDLTSGDGGVFEAIVSPVSILNDAALQNVGGIAGSNSGTVTQSINTGNVGSGNENNVGGLVGDNLGQVDDSYSGGNQSVTISGNDAVGGLAGVNEAGATLETSYTTGSVNGNSDVGAVIGVNGSSLGESAGIVRHVYWDTDDTGGPPSDEGLPGIGTDDNSPAQDTAGVIDLTGYTTAQLTDSRNYVQGSAPLLWNFTPEQGADDTVVGTWGVNVYTDYGSIDGVPVNGLVNGGLPVLQWQYPIAAQVTATNGTRYYGYTPGYTVTGSGASTFTTEVTQPSFGVSGNNGAGDTQTLTISGTPVNGGYNVEYVNGTVSIVTDPVTIAADSYTVQVGTSTPTLQATYSGFQTGHSESDLEGQLQLTVTPQPSTGVGLYTITPSGLSSPTSDVGQSNYLITYLTGVLDIVPTVVTPAQQLLTFRTEIASLQNQMAHDPTNGLAPFGFTILPSQAGLGGDLEGAINDLPGAGDYAFSSSTSTLPSFSRLATPDSGVMVIIDGVVLVGAPQTGNPVFLNGYGNFLPQQALTNLSGVLSAGVAGQLLPLTHGD